MKGQVDILKQARLNALILFSLAAMFLICFSCKDKTEDHITHEHDMSDMKGMSVENSNESISDTAILSSLAQPVSVQVLSSQKSVKPSFTLKQSNIKAQGYISLDETRNHKVAAKISGRVEKLFVKYNMQYVHRGDKIMEVYSPDLNTYQEELLYLVKNKSDQTLVDQAIQKLRLLGIAQDQITMLLKTGVPFFTLNVYSPQNGYVFFRSQSTMSKKNLDDITQSVDSKMGGMQAPNSNQQSDFASTSQQLREGDYINKGDILFWINDLQQVWGVIAVDNSQQQELRLSSKVFLISELHKDDTVAAKINFIEPVYQPDQKFIRARIYLNNNTNKYKINSLIVAEIITETKPSMWVPYNSVLFLGKRKMIWVLKAITPKGNKLYESRDVITGLIRYDMVEIKKGINANDEIAQDAGYLLDRESLVKPE